MNKQKLKIAYEVVFSLLALLSIGITIFDFSGKINLEEGGIWFTVDNAIMIVFAVDYLVRLILSKGKKRFIRENIPDLISIIPFSSLFRVFRVAKLFRVLKVAKVIKLARFARVFALFFKFKKSAFRFLRTNGLIYMMVVTFVLIFLGAAGIYYFEKGITVNSFPDAIWWSFVTATTVGYGDISPVTGFGRVIAALLMLAGIGTIGLLTGTIATYFTRKPKEPTATEERTIDLSGLTDQQYREVVDYVEFLKSKDQ